MAARFTDVVLRVRDLKRSVEFYRDVLGVAVEPGDEAASHYEVAWGDWSPERADLVMFLIYGANPEHPPSVCEVGFAVPDLDEVHARVEATGCPVVAGPSPKPWGMQASYRDPDGNVVSVAQQPVG